MVTQMGFNSVCTSTYTLYIRVYQGFIYHFSAIHSSNCHYPSLSAAGDDYISVSAEDLVFDKGDTRVCHTVSIIDDGSCEIESVEDFFTLLQYISGIEPISINPSEAHVTINDSEEQECGE